MAKKVLGLVYINEHRALFGAASMYADLIRAKGYEVEVFNLAQDGAGEKLSQILNPDEVAFCYAPQGVGSRLGNSEGRTIWEQRRIPFVGLHGDNPCYNIFNHFSNTSYVANLYLYESFVDLHHRYIGGNQVVGHVPMRTGDVGLEPLPFLERPIKLLYLKKGESVQECVNVLNGLQPALRDAVWQQLERTPVSPNLLVCDLVQEIFDQMTISRAENFDLFWGCVHWMDMYIRRKRAADFVDWLKMQDDAVIVGDGWDFIDRTNVRATFKPSVDLYASSELYKQAQIICNTSPYGRDVLHERTIFGLLNHSITISDTNEWWDKHFGDIPALKRFSWGEPLGDQLHAIVNRPNRQFHCEAHFDAYTGRVRALEYFRDLDIVEPILACVERVKVLGANI